MKKLMMILMAVPISLYAGPDDTNEVCKRNTLVMVVLQNKVNGIDAEFDKDTMRWTVDFGYDLFASAHPDGVERTDIVGRVTCNDINTKSTDDGQKSDDVATPGDANTFLKATPGDVGKNCWCKMDGPVTSWWTYVNEYATEGECSEFCAEYCATNFSNNGVMSNGVPLREALFNKIW